MLFSTLLSVASIASAAPLAKRDGNCQVLSTLFLQCSNGDSQAPSIYPPNCEIHGDGYTKCCAVNQDGSVTDNCRTTDPWTGDWVGCVTIPDTLQTICRNPDMSFNMLSPICHGSSDGSHKCCARNQDGSENQQCVQ